MFHYKVEDVVLTHTSPISPKEFNDMVFKAMQYIEEGYLNPDKVADYLVYNKGFTRLNTIAEVDLYKIYEEDSKRFSEE